MKIHQKYIKRALQLAQNALPNSMPNPAVGAVLVHQETIIGEGYTSAYGGSHAEVNCITFAKANTPTLIPESTLYVTLEPCSHFGKTPPCANLIIDSGIKRVVIGTIDPHAKVSGNGIKLLLEAGIDVTVGVLEAECYALNKRFFTFHEKKRPYIILKWAQTSDGFIAPEKRDAQAPVWITNTYSRQLVHKWRSEEMGILVGAATVAADNPSLTTRDWEGASPLRIVLDPRENLSRDLAVFNEAAETISHTTEDPKEVCQILFEKNIQSLIVEGGAKTLQRFIDANLWDEARVFKGEAAFSKGVKAPVFNSSTILEETFVLKDRLTFYKNSNS